MTIAQQERFQQRVRLKFSVLDTGMGMTAEQSARLFQAFSQADTSDHTQVRGHRSWALDLQATGRNDGRGYLGRE